MPLITRQHFTNLLKPIHSASTDFCTPYTDGVGIFNFTVSKQVDGKSAAAVTQATTALLEPLKDVVYAITADNGKEFAYHEKISVVLEADFYFA